MNNQQDTSEDESSATVLPLRPRPSRLARADDGRRGDVLLFTGVRYERHHDAGQPALPPQPSAGGLGGPRRRA